MKKEGRSIKEIMDEFSPERQKRIREIVAKDKEEYKSLKAFRKALGMTQTDVADNQGKKQVNIAQLEGRSDMKLSTLKEYIEALGCELVVHVKIPRSDSVVRIDL